MLPKSRQPWIDAAKGFGVLLVIIGHLLYSSTLDNLNQAIYSFHTPLFFMLSGYVDHRSTNRKDYYKRKIRRLVIPYVIFVAMSFQLIHRQYLLGDSIDRIVKDIFYYDGRIAFNCPLWFIAVLFQVYLVSGLINWEQVNKYGYCFILVALCFLNLFIFRANEAHCGCDFNRFGFNRTTIALFFFTIGKAITKYWKAARKIDILVAGVAFLIWYYSAMIANRKVSLYSYSFDSMWWFLVSGTLGSLVVILLFRQIKNCQILRTIGRHSIIYLGTQYLWIVPFTEYVKENGWDKTNRYVIAMFLMTLVYVFIVEAGIFVFERVKEKYES